MMYCWNLSAIVLSPQNPKTPVDGVLNNNYFVKMSNHSDIEQCVLYLKNNLNSTNVTF